MSPQVNEKYKNYLKSSDWAKKRATKVAKKSRCAICAGTDRLQVHHLAYRNLTDVAQSDLRVLCDRCHELAHRLVREGRVTLKGRVVTEKELRQRNHHSHFIIIKNAVKKELAACVSACEVRACG